MTDSLAATRTIPTLEVDEAVALVVETDFGARPELADAFAAHPAFQVKLKLAQTLPLREFPLITRTLALCGDSLVAKAVVEHAPLADFPDIARELCMSAYSSVRQAVAKRIAHDQFPDVVDVYLENNDISELVALASGVSRSSPAQLVSRLCADIREEIRCSLAAAIPFDAFPSQIKTLAHDRVPAVSDILAERVRNEAGTHPTPVLWSMLDARPALASQAAHVLARHHQLSDDEWAVLVSRKDFEPTQAERNPHATDEQRAGFSMFGAN